MPTAGFTQDLAGFWVPVVFCAFKSDENYNSIQTQPLYFQHGGSQIYKVCMWHACAYVTDTACRHARHSIPSPPKFRTNLKWDRPICCAPNEERLAHTLVLTTSTIAKSKCLIYTYWWLVFMWLDMQGKAHSFLSHKHLNSSVSIMLCSTLFIPT